jgi:hypothetical protein
MAEFAALQHLAPVIDIAGPGRPEREAADGIGKAAAGDGGAFLLQPGRRGVVGGEQTSNGAPFLIWA